MRLAACLLPTFFTFTHVCGAALIAVCRLASVEFFALAADESLIHAAEHIAMSDVPEFLGVCSQPLWVARGRFGGLSFGGVVLDGDAPPNTRGLTRRSSERSLAVGSPRTFTLDFASLRR